MGKTACYPVPYKWGRERGAKLSPSAFKLYHMLLGYSDHKTQLAHPSQATLAKLVGVSTRRIRDLIEELVKAKLVHVQQYGDGRTNTYWVRQPLADYAQSQAV